MVSADVTTEQLDKVLNSPEFVSAPKLTRFLRHCVECELAGDRSHLKESSIGVAVFDRRPDYDPKLDPIVRVQAGRLRAKLLQYYSNRGSADAIRFDIPKGTYVPTIVTVAAEPAQAALPLAEPELPKLHRRLPPMWQIASAAVLCLVLVFVLRPTQVSAVPFDPVPLSSLPGDKSDPAWSPDGRTLAFAWDNQQQGQTRIFLQSLQAAEPVRLTNGEVDEIRPVWSPSGQEIAFLRKIASNRFAIVRQQRVGGKQWKLGEVSFHLAYTDYKPALDWSPDGKWIVASNQAEAGTPIQLQLISTQDGTAKVLTSPPAQSTGDMDARFSPDGRRVAFRRGGVGDLYVVDVAKGETSAQALTRDNRGVRGVSWSGSDTILYGSHRAAIGYGIFQLNTSTSDIQQVTPGGWEATWPVTQPRTRRFAMVQNEIDIDLAQVSVEKGESRFLPISTRSEYEPAHSPDGSLIAFVSTRSGARELWLARPDGASPRQITTFQGDGFPIAPAWSPDNKQIVFSVRQNGFTHLYLVEAATGKLRKLSDGPDRRLLPKFSPDGKFLYFNSNEGGKMRIWRSKADGSGEPQVVVEQAALAFQPDSDGNTLFYLTMNDPRLIRLDLKTGEVLQSLGRDMSDVSSWSVSGGRVYVTTRPTASRKLCRLLEIDWNSHNERTLFSGTFPPDALEAGLSVAPGGRSILIPVVRHWRSEIYLADRP